MNELQFEKIQTPTGRITDVFGELEKQTIWHQPQEDMYIIFHQEVQPARQLCYWYNGEVATIILQNKLFIKLHALKNTFSNSFKTDESLRCAIQKNKVEPPTWLIDIYTMNECIDLEKKVKGQLFKVDCLKDKLKGSFELSSYDFKDAILEIYSDTKMLIKYNN